MRIEYICFTGYSGFAYAAKNNIKALVKAGYDVSVNPLDLGFSKSINLRDFDFFSKLVDGQKGDVQIFHCVPFMQRRVPYLGKVIGYGTFENAEYPQEWINTLQNNSVVLAPSKFNFDMLSPDLNNVKYLPHCLDISEYSYFDKREFPIYSFLFLATWKNRKNYKNLIEAFIEEFSGRNDVELVIKSHESSYIHPSTEISRISKRLGKTANIRVDATILKDEDIPNYLHRFNCFILPTLGEGFCYPGLQAMASGLPVIITNYSGCQEYANPYTALLLNAEYFVKKANMDGLVQFRDKIWPRISVERIRDKMRFAFENREHMQDLASSAYAYVECRFDYKNIVEKFSEIL